MTLKASLELFIFFSSRSWIRLSLLFMYLSPSLTMVWDFCICFLECLPFFTTVFCEQIFPIYCLGIPYFLFRGGWVENLTWLIRSGCSRGRLIGIYSLFWSGKVLSTLISMYGFRGTWHSWFTFRPLMSAPTWLWSYFGWLSPRWGITLWVLVCASEVPLP